MRFTARPACPHLLLQQQPEEGAAPPPEYEEIVPPAPRDLAALRVASESLPREAVAAPPSLHALYLSSPRAVSAPVAAAGSEKEATCAAFAAGAIELRVSSAKQRRRIVHRAREDVRAHWEVAQDMFRDLVIQGAEGATRGHFDLPALLQNNPEAL